MLLAVGIQLLLKLIFVLSTNDFNVAMISARTYGICFQSKSNVEANTDVKQLETGLDYPGEEQGDQLPCVCTEMVPRNMHFPPQTTPCPWHVYPSETKIPQFYSHTVTLGSTDGNSIFLNYVVAAKSVENGQIVGHFEYQWDAIAVCCYKPGRNYSYEGKRLYPNLLVGSQSIRVPKPNQTVVWTAPRHWEGSVVFVYRN